ncbi:MAG: hypothetical protein EOP38_17845 [Rubrivivax sp.]|nr:MAG: hypothetical protein EOP38_17845 [Rubrivivax sp.]
MASISFAGPSSGIDVSSIVTQQLNVEKQPVADQRLPQAELDTVQTKLSTMGKLQSALSDYQSTAQALSQDSNWSNIPTAATSSQPAAVSASSDGSAASGDYSVEVNGLAAAQTTTSASFSGVGTVIGLGTLHIEIGGWNSSQTAFSTNPNWPKSDVKVGPHDNSLEKIRDKINAAGVGVVASVISDATGSRLVLRSTSTGQENGFKVSATEEGKSAALEPGLAALAFDPSLSQNRTAQTQAAADAKGKVNGVEFTSPSNTVTNAVEGLTLKFSKVTDGPVDVSVAPDKDALKKSITDFATAHNELNALGQAPTGLNRQLSSIGLETDKQGNLSVNSVKLDKALANRPQQVKEVFAAASQTASQEDRRRVADPPAGPSYAVKLLSQYRALEPGSSTPAATTVE